MLNAYFTGNPSWLRKVNLFSKSLSLNTSLKVPHAETFTIRSNPYHFFVDNYPKIFDNL